MAEIITISRRAPTTLPTISAMLPSLVSPITDGTIVLSVVTVGVLVSSIGVGIDAVASVVGSEGKLFNGYCRFWHSCKT